METIEDEARLGRPFYVRNEGLIAKVRKRIQEERCVTVRMMCIMQLAVFIITRMQIR